MWFGGQRAARAGRLADTCAHLPLRSRPQGLTSVLLCMFCVILAAGVAQHSDLPAALLAGPADWGALQPAVPIMFLAL